ncbi:hypothetical protein AAFF_G00172590 [Aldrovandia affinis]|uniref:Endonuclease/exonuclease/phosphatase domain-containing protein n=1 Tax=Aldrovandia affinis TaxID=143900 RepID=A0AAD7WW78_9TELE|nr:hypothetical protein AAFF_G00172590 [Aldrovandia affinis]
MRDYRLDILGISEMRWTGQGRLVIDGTTVLYSGKQDHHTHGVGLILFSCAAQALVGWRPVNERIITARLYTRHAKVTIVQVYAPTKVASEEKKDIFYTQLQGVLEEIPSYDIKLFIGDFNAKLDSDRRGLHTTVAPHGSKIHKVTWVSPDGNTRNELDYICTSTRWSSSLVDVRSHRGADVGSDHYLVEGKIRLKLKKVQTVRAKRAYAVDKLKNDVISKRYCEEFSKKLEVLQHPSSIEEQWGWFSRAISETAVAVLGRRRGYNKERWISDRTWNLIDERKMAKIRREQKRGLRRWRMEDEEYRPLDKEVKKSCRNNRRRWLAEKAREAQEAAEKNKMKTLYRIMRELTSSRSSSGVPIRSKDGRALLSDEEQEASDLRLRDVDEDSQHHQHVGCLPLTMPQNHLEDLMVHITNEEVMRRTGVALLSDMVSDRRRRLAGHTPTAKRTTSECGNGLGARGRQEEEREAKEDVKTYV